MITGLFIQCQACATESHVRTMLQGAWLPWRCPSCRARHKVTVGKDAITDLRLIDRVQMPPGLECSAEVLSDLQEAVNALNAQAPKASVVMVRRALERVCDELGAKGGRLVDKVKDLTSRGVFDAAHGAAAQAMRLFGNYGAHPGDDLLDEADMKKAEQVLTLLVNLLEDISSRS
jgi:hypothetical protein